MNMDEELRMNANGTPMVHKDTTTIPNGSPPKGTSATMKATLRRAASHCWLAIVTWQLLCTMVLNS